VLSEAADARLLDELPLLTGLAPEVRRLVEYSFTTLQLGFGEVVFRQGDPPDAYYVVADGTARVLADDAAGHEVSLNILRPGDSFGEAALVDDAPRTATVRASSPLRLLRLDAGVFRAVVELYPETAERFRQAERNQQINDFLRLHSAFAVLPRDVALELIGRLHELEAADGEDVVRQGDAADALYLVQDGRLGVWISDPDAPPRRVATVHSGEFFGELALIRQSTRTASVRAEGPVRLLVLEGDYFRRLVADNEAFAARVDERLALYQARERRRSAGFSGAVAAPASSDAAASDEIWTSADPGLALTDAGEAPEGAPAFEHRRRVPFVRQIDEMDCGAACISMLCRYYGQDVSMASIRGAVGTDVSGTSLSGLLRGGREIGFEMRAIKSSAERLDALSLPAIIHWEGNHWVIAERVEGERVRLVDPARGRRAVRRDEVAGKWSGYTALATPTEALAQAPRGGLDLHWLLPFIRPHRRALAIALVLSLVAAGFEMALPIFSQIIVDRVIGHHDEGLLYVVVAAMLGALLIAVGVTIAQRYLLARVASHVDEDTLDFVSARLLRLPMRYFETRRTGDIQRRISGMRQVRTVLVQNGLLAMTAATQLIVAVVIMFVYSASLGVLFLLGGPLYAGLMRFSQRRLRPMFDTVEEGQARYESRQIDAIRGIETVKAMGAEDSLRRRMADEFGLLREKLLSADMVTMTYEGLVTLATFFAYAVFLFVGALEVLHHSLTVGALVAVSGLVLLANTPIVLLLGLWDRLQLVTVLLGRLQDVFEQEPEQGHDHSRLRAPGALEGHIRLRRTGFAYANAPDRPILQDISLDVAPGTTVGLVGRSGSGKSTLVKCLAGLLVPTMGAIEYDGVDLRELRFSELRRRIGFVLQTPYLFDDTIEANIAFGEERPDPGRVRWAAEVADAAEFCEHLPLGYQTRVGDSGLRLSGGQAQRISIARALYHQPPVLIFDEATSALDTEAERAVKQNTDRLLEGRTAFVVAHRLSTIRDADVICVLEQGRLVEHGTHEELVRRQGLYAYLQAQQFAG
jgi:ABC-type bacteriocin/lantibiotic exporter with double-glycine peptidase domain/CRP-like cAMP-binding protein